MECDALIVGGGPVGLVLAIGLQQKGVKVLVLEMDNRRDVDWNRSYTYRLNSRALACLDKLGLAGKVETVGAPMPDFTSVMWGVDGSKKLVKPPAAIGVGYVMQRPALLDLLDSELAPGTLVNGALTELVIEDQVLASVTMQDGTVVKLTAQVAFGCDGAHSTLRHKLATIDPGFQMSSVVSPSTGLLFKAMLYKPPEHVETDRIHVVKGLSGRPIFMLPFVGKRGDPRPLQLAASRDHPLFLVQSATELLAHLQKEYPQLLAADNIDMASAESWVKSKGTTFPEATWCQKASCWKGSAGAAILGDALHSFPPDLGQGVNAGFSDALRLLELWPAKLDSSGAEAMLMKFQESQVREAEAICRLLPVGMPYQYEQPLSLGKASFMLSLIFRLLAWKLCPIAFSAPPVFMVTEDPPVKYADIWVAHQKNTRRLHALAAASVLALFVAFRSRMRK